MKNRGLEQLFSKLASTAMLLAGAFFVCATILSMRSVLADPIQPQVAATYNGAQSARATQNPRAAAAQKAQSAGRTGGAVASSRANNAVNSSRAVANRSGTNSAASAPRNQRAVVSRAAVSKPGAAASSARSVRARVGVSGNAGTASRVSLPGQAIRAGTTVLQTRLATATYSNIVDPSTGLISAEAYSNCLESYYTCMDEICTARNIAQNRCACAGRVKAFNTAEIALSKAKEEYIKVVGQLELLRITKGKEVSSAFTLTDAEKTMNCVSWKDANAKGDAALEEWCVDHNMIGGTNSDGSYFADSTCKSGLPYCNGQLGFTLKDLDGNNSDIMATLQAYVEVMEQTDTFTKNDDNALINSILNTANLININLGLNGVSDSTEIRDSLANTWGYELFEYAHNNVCNRVLDSCFNGIYEACGTPPRGGNVCTNGSTVCPYNYNTMVSVNNTGEYSLEFVKPNTGYTNTSATCYGYATATGDPYQTLRGPVADARRSILQKYALDSNAACDVYGEELRKTAQNVEYQKVAAEQALQQLRLKFKTDEANEISSAVAAAKTNYTNCVSEIYDCLVQQNSGNPTWGTARVLAYCSQTLEVPSCYQDMICDQNAIEVISEIDSATCKYNAQEYGVNTCRNVVSISEILKPSYATATAPNATVVGDSRAYREYCLSMTPLVSGDGAIRDFNSKRWGEDDTPTVPEP